MPAPDIFLSYSRSDSERAKMFADALQSEELEVWWDTAIRAGQAFDEEIETALRSAKAVVVLWSKNSVYSRWVRAEATLAERLNTLVPCLIEACERPIAFELIQTVDLSRWDGAINDPLWQSFVAELTMQIEGCADETVGCSAMPEALGNISSKPLEVKEPLLAVLPFDNMSSDAEMTYFSDGISEDILGRVASGSDLKVVGRALSFNFRGADKSNAAKALGATHLLDGSIRRAGNKVRIFAHLTEASGLTTLWSAHYDRDLGDIFAVQDEISEAIALALNVAFSPSEEPNIDPLAYDLYLQLRQLMYRSTDIDRFETLSDAIVKMAPDFADGWALRALVLNWQSTGLPYADRDEIVAEGKEALTRALAIDPECANAVAAEWAFCDPFGEFLKQGECERKWNALWDEAGIANVHHPFHLECVGRVREAITLMQEYRARKAYVADSYLGMAIWRSGQFAKGRAMLEQSLASEPSDYQVRATLIAVYLKDGDHEALSRLLDPEVLARFPLGEYAWAAEARKASIDGSPEVARAFLENYSDRQIKSGTIEPYLLALWSDMGFTDEAYEIAERVRFGVTGGIHDVMGGNAYRTHMLFSAAYPQLRDDRRFVKVCARLGLVEYWLATGHWPDCSDEVAYDFRTECKKFLDYPKDKFLPHGV